jgi:hypothetical protein
MRTQAIAISALSMLLPLISPVKAEETRTINGVLTLSAPWPLVTRWQGECFGTSGLSDVRGGMAVVIRDGKNEILAVGKTESGTDYKGDREICRFPFKIENVPARNIYSVQVGRRNPVVFSAAQLEEDKWTANIAISVRPR